MRKLSSWIFISGLLLMLLGIIHIVAYIKVADMFSTLAEKQFSVFSFMYLATGLGTVLPGLITVFLVRVLSKSTWLALLSCAIFTLVVGIGAAVYMPQNPFALIYPVIGLSLLIPTVLIRKHLSTK